jgi:DNA-binding transcriptional regulator YiaG
MKKSVAEEQSVMKPSVAQRIVQRLEEFADALESRQPLTEQFNCRRRVLKLKPKPYDPAQVKKVRETLGISQSVFAIYLGVSSKTVQAWERGDLSPNTMACRFMDEIQRSPKSHRKHLEEMFVAKG